MAIPKQVEDHFDKTETSIDQVVDELVFIAQAKFDESYDDISKDSMSKIHADIMSEVFIKLGQRMMLI